MTLPDWHEPNNFTVSWNLDMSLAPRDGRPVLLAHSWGADLGWRYVTATWQGYDDPSFPWQDDNDDEAGYQEDWPQAWALIEPPSEEA